MILYFIDVIHIQSMSKYKWKGCNVVCYLSVSMVLLKYWPRCTLLLCWAVSQESKSEAKAYFINPHLLLFECLIQMVWNGAHRDIGLQQHCSIELSEANNHRAVGGRSLDRVETGASIQYCTVMLLPSPSWLRVVTVVSHTLNIH